MDLPGTESYPQDVFLVQKGTLLRLGGIYLALVVTEKKRSGILCIAPVLVRIRQVRTWYFLTLFVVKCCTEFVARRFYRLAVCVNCTGRIVPGYNSWKLE